MGGPAGFGKPTFSENFVGCFRAGESVVVVPLEGFFFVDGGLMAGVPPPRKVALFFFDVLGFEVLLKRIKAREPDIAIPVFDRTMELSRAAADIVDGKAKFDLIEGNYLLLKQPPWNRLRQLFDFSIY